MPMKAKKKAMKPSRWRRKIPYFQVALTRPMPVLSREAMEVKDNATNREIKKVHLDFYH
jgi:hypothetical protein